MSGKPPRGSLKTCPGQCSSLSWFAHLLTMTFDKYIFNPIRVLKIEKALVHAQKKPRGETRFSL